MIKNLKDIETALGLKEGEFKTLYEDAAEKEIDITKLEIIPKDDYATRIANIKKDAGIAAVEIAVKEARTKKGLDFTGKTIDNLLDAFGTKTLADAKVEPDKKVAELTTDLATMKGNYEKELQLRTGLETTYKQKDAAQKISSVVMGALPKELILEAADAAELTLRKASAAGITPEISDAGDVVFKKGDQIMKDTNLVPLKGDVVLKEYYSAFIKPASGGSGGQDNPGQAKAGTMEAFVNEMAKQNVNEGSAKFNEEMSKRIKEKTLVL